MRWAGAPPGTRELRRGTRSSRAVHLTACFVAWMAIGPTCVLAIVDAGRMVVRDSEAADGAYGRGQDSAGASAACDTFRCRLTAALKSEECADKRIPRSIRKQFKGTSILVERALAKPEESRKRERLANRARILLGHAQIRTFRAQKFAKR